MDISFQITCKISMGEPTDWNITKLHTQTHISSRLNVEIHNSPQETTARDHKTRKKRPMCILCEIYCKAYLFVNEPPPEPLWILTDLVSLNYCLENVSCSVGECVNLGTNAQWLRFTPTDCLANMLRAWPWMTCSEIQIRIFAPLPITTNFVLLS